MYYRSGGTIILSPHRTLSSPIHSSSSSVSPCACCVHSHYRPLLPPPLSTLTKMLLSSFLSGCRILSAATREGREEKEYLDWPPPSLLMHANHTLLSLSKAPSPSLSPFLGFLFERKDHRRTKREEDRRPGRKKENLGLRPRRPRKEPASDLPAFCEGGFDDLGAFNSKCYKSG